jgi:REP element-mobilizing transposase RayT
MTADRTLRRPPHADMGVTAYFVSTRTANHSRLFVGEFGEAAVRELRAARAQYGFRLLSYCFMPDHAHFVIVPAEGFSISQTMRVIKGSIGRCINDLRNDDSPVWQEGFFDKVVFTREQLNAYIEYTEQNPVKGGLAAEAPQYRLSSADGSCVADYEAFLGLGDGGECAVGDA